jgi:hypothetical protein
MCDSPISGLVECQNRANSSDDLQRLACPDVACRVLVSGSPADKDQESRCYEPPIRIPAPLWADSQPDTTVLVKGLNTVLASRTPLTLLF